MNKLKNLSESQLEQLLDLKKIRQEKARRSLLEFTKYTFPGIYQVNWHHKIFCDALEKWVRGDIKRLMIFTPPRSGKSELVSRRLPAYAFGKNPDLQVISCSYSAFLAQKMNRDVQRIIDSPTYKELFPKVGLFGQVVRTTGKEGTYLRNMDTFEIVNFTGCYTCAGVSGPIGGLGFDRGIIDDPIKNRAEANSATFRDRVWDWYTSTFRTRRISDNAGILLTLTRWHEDDLAGRLLRLAKSDPEADQWTVIKFPMIAEESLTEGDPREPGDPLWPDRFSLKDVLTTKVSMGSYDFSSLMQQNPTPSEGARIKRDWLVGKYVNVPTDLSKLKITMGVDLAISEKASADFTAIAVLGRDKLGQIYVLSIERMKGTFREQIQFIKRLADKWHPFVIGIEDVGYQRVMSQQLSMETNLNIKRIPVDKDKFSRFAPMENRYEQGIMYHVRDLPGYFETELFGFGAGAEHDDMIDAMSIAWACQGTLDECEILMPGMLTRDVDWRV